jgi:hypothetical protein
MVRALFDNLVACRLMASRDGQAMKPHGWVPARGIIRLDRPCRFPGTPRLASMPCQQAAADSRKPNVAKQSQNRLV